RLPRFGCSTMKLTPPAAGTRPEETSPRWGSPCTGCSTLITSAPQSASTAPAAGTNHHCATSMTRTPCSTASIAALASTPRPRLTSGRRCRPWLHASAQERAMGVSSDLAGRQSHDAWSRVLPFVLPGIIVLVTAVAFLPVLGNGFVDYDDRMLIVDNVDFRGLGWRQLTWMFTTTLGGPYLPLTWLSYA